MTTSSSLLASLTLAGGLLTAALPVHAQSNVDELSSGAAAAAVLMLRCEPGNFERVQQLAFEHMQARARGLPARDQALVLDSAQRKVRAFAISSQSTPCGRLEGLRAMARTWGFAHLVREGLEIAH